MDYLEMTGALTGLIYLWLEYKASICLWLASIVMPAVCLVVLFPAGFGLLLFVGIDCVARCGLSGGWKRVQIIRIRHPYTRHWSGNGRK